MSFENVEDVYVLSPMQQGILFHTLYAPQSEAYTIQTAWAINGSFSAPKFGQSWQVIVDHHPILRTSFVWEGLDKPLQVVHQRVEISWEEHHWCDIPADEQEIRWEQFLENDRARDFQLNRAPLMRLSLFQLAENSYRFIWSYHHLLLDGWSYPQVLKEVLATYDALCRGEHPSLERRRPYRDYIAWLQKQDLSRAEAFWRQTLKGFSAPTRLTVDKMAGERSEVPGRRSAEQELIIPEETTAALQAFAQGHRLTLNTMVQGAWALLLNYYSGEKDVIYGTVVSGRPVTLTGVESIVGLFVNTLPVRVQVSPQVELLSWLKELQRQQVELREYEYSPLVQVQGWSDVPRGLPLFETILAYENYPVVALTQEENTGFTFSPVSGFTRTNYPLELIVVPRTTLRLRVSYDTERFESDAISRMLGHFQNLLEGMPRRASQPLSSLPVLSAAERQLVLNEWSVAGQPKELAGDELRRLCVHQLVEAQVERRPEAVAVIYEGESLTYKVLDRRANQLAHYLQQQGVGPQVRVGVYLRRSLELIVSLLAVLKAGGAYVPLDPAYPRDRMAYMLSDARVQLVLTQMDLWEQLRAAEVPIFCLEALRDGLAQLPATAIASALDQEQLAYVMYTSGSTGRPKGIAITHRGIVNLAYQPRYIQVTTSDVFLLMSSIAFDVSAFEIWTSLINGARLVVPPSDLPSLAQIAQVIHQHQVSILWLTAGLFQQMVDLHLEGLRPVKQLLAGGEALSVAHVRQAVAGLPHCQLINGYGPTENSTFSCCYAVQRTDRLEPSVPIGKPLPERQAYVLDEQLRPLPIGAVGELFVGGAGLARCYFNRPDLTAESFVPDPFSAEPGARLYRTGDLVRWRPEGQLEFLERRDGQVKLRGYRIECGEIESRLLLHPTVRSAAVVVRKERPGDLRLVAYLVPRQPAYEAQHPSVSQLLQHLRSWLPDYMLPAAFVWLDALPLTPNGKLDRQLLPAPERDKQEGTIEYVAPRTPIEQKLANLWEDMFQLGRVGITDNFFELGGHSILAIRLIGQIQAMLNIQLPLRAIFENPTVADLALAVRQKQLAQEKPSQPDTQITARARDVESLPLSFEQRRLWFIDQLAPGNPAYNSPVSLRLRGQLDVDALHQGINEIIRRHEVLRTTFTSRDGQPIQVISRPPDVPLSMRDLSELPESQREATAYHLACEEAQRPFDIVHGPVLRVQLLRLGPDEHILVLTLHHIVVDAWSVGIFFRELAILYDAYRRAQPSPLPALSIQYADYALWQYQILQGVTLNNLLAYWRRHLANLPVLKLPTDRPRPHDLSHQGAKFSIALPQALKEALQAIGQQEQATLFMTMLTAFQILLARYSGQEDIVIGSSTAGRSREELEGLIGFFVNMLVLRTDLSGAPSFREALRRVREECLQAYAHQEFPFELLVEELHPERDPTRTPLFQVLFQSVEGPGDNSEFPGLSIESFAISTETSKFDLLWSMREPAEGIIVEVEYSTALFEAETIRRMLGHYQTLLEGIITNPDQPMKDLPLLTAGEKERILGIWNQTQTPYPDHLCLHELFEAQVQRQPQAIALTLESQRVTYAQLNGRANQLAHYLRGLGVGPEVVVGLYVERTVDMVVGLLAILKTGGAYAPLDPGYPKERLAFMLAETSAPVVLTVDRLLPGLPKHKGMVVRLDTDWPQISQENSDNPVSGVGPANLAYIIYTSGSTGTPKGIAVLHGGVVNNITDLNRRFAVNSSDKVLALSSLSFDMCVYEVMGILGTGGAIVLPPASSAKDPACWAELLARHQITLWNSAPSLLELLVEHCEHADAAPPLHLRLALLGGDWIPVTLPDRIKALAPEIQFISLGGATEASIHSIIYPVKASDPSWISIPYGCPMANQHAYILDANLQPVPVGVPGELHLGGVGLARGYLHRPDLTAEKFIPHPFGHNPGERLYKTGDLARYHSDGTIELLGRMDFLVKIHGLRIELGEIESALKQHPALQDAVVLVKEDIGGDKQLLAYVVLRGREPEPTATELRAFLSGKLPDYMQPKAFIFLDKLPLSPNGKIDRKGLPELDQAHRQTREAFISPRDALEMSLASVWSAILGIDQIGIDDNFFELGGDSFKAIRTTRACSDTLTLIDFFKHPTIRGLAAHLRQKSGSPTQLLYELTQPSTGAKLSLVCVPYGGGNAISYQPLANSLPKGYSLYSVALPGHDFVHRNEPLLPLETVANDCVEEIIRMMNNEPLALYGQCAGVALTIEIARLLEQRNVPIKAIYLGAALPDREPVRSIEFERGISDEEMLEWLRWLGGFEDILDPEEIKHIINTVRHDLVNAANYYSWAYSSQLEKLRSPIFCIIGTEDAATRNYGTRFQEWSYFGESVELTVLEGAGHYFVKHNASELARIISGI